MENTEPLFADDPSSDTKTAILKATFDALSEHGYADLTISRISQNFSKSEGLVFYHYNNKDEILLDLLDYLLEQFVQVDMPIARDGDPETRLRRLFNNVIPETGEQQIRDYERVLMELRMRAAQDKDFEECFNRFQNKFHEIIMAMVQDGIESGDFRDGDPEQIADFLIALISGGIFDRVTAGVSRPIQSELDNYIEYRLLADKEHKHNGEEPDDIS